MPRTLNIACLQTRPKPDFLTALDEAIELAKLAVKDGAQLLVLPEYCGGLKTDGAMFAPPAADEEAHPVLLGLQSFAEQNQVWIIIGSIAVPEVSGKILNRSFVISPDGKIINRYDKIHLFDIQLSDTEVYRESARVIPGAQAVITDTPIGKFGHSICYDLRFPQLYRDLAQAGAEILLVPAAFTKTTGEAHWHVLNRARAIENGAFVVAPCAIGPVDGGGESYGHSLIIDPWGKVLADGGSKPGVVQAVIDLDAVAQTRTKIPNLKDAFYQLAVIDKTEKPE